MLLYKIRTYKVIFTIHKDYDYMFRQLLAILSNQNVLLVAHSRDFQYKRCLLG